MNVRDDKIYLLNRNYDKIFTTFTIRDDYKKIFKSMKTSVCTSLSTNECLKYLKKKNSIRTKYYRNKKKCEIKLYIYA